jgi:polyphosphate glucokinase
MQVLGIDVGGTGIKGNIVDIESGNLIAEKLKIKTPTPATPKAILDCVTQMVDHFNWRGKQVGIGFPAVIKNGYSLTASNIDAEFINYPISEVFNKSLGCDTTIVNDADAAGLAEMTYGEGKGVKGLVIFITLGTGIGSALFLDGRLIGNTEFGHLKYKKSIFEKYASNSARENKHLSWRKWAKELNVYLNHLDLLLSPDMIIIGGGISKNFNMYGPLLSVKTVVKPASMMNDAGIVGAAMAAVK